MNLGRVLDRHEECPGCGVTLTDRWLKYRADHRRGELVNLELRCPGCDYNLLSGVVDG